MNCFVDCDLSEFRAFIFQYARRNPSQQNPIRSVLQTVIQSELKSSVHETQQTPDPTPSTPHPHASNTVLKESEIHCSADRRGKDRRDGGRSRPSGIKLPHTVVPASSVGAEDHAHAQRVSKRLKAGTIPQPSPAVIEKTPSTCTADHVSIDKPSAANIYRRRKKRETCSDAIAAPKTLHIIPSPKPNRSPTCAHPHASDNGTVGPSAIPPDLVSKVSLVGSIEVLRDLKHTLFRLRSHSSQSWLAPNHEASTPCTTGSHETLRSLQAAQILSMLRNELEVTEIGEQLYRFRKRLALSQFFDFYEFAQKNPSSFLQEGSDTIQGPSRTVSSKQAPRLDSRVLNRIVDLMFPNTVDTNGMTVAASEKYRQMYEEGQRAAAVQKTQDWRRNGKPWSAIIKRFGRGVLLLLPKNLSDEK